jgi:hypothetical protein
MVTVGSITPSGALRRGAPRFKEKYMKRRFSVATIGAVAAAAACSAIAGPHAFGVAAAKAHTHSFDAKRTSSFITGRSSFVLSDKDVHGSTQVGSDVLSCTTGATRDTCHVAFGQKDGLLYARFVLKHATGSLNGTVTGGTGPYKHATGTLKGIARSQTDVHVTLHYTK